MTYNTIRFQVEGRVATLTLDRPDKLNAFTGEMMEELIDAFDRVDADDDVRAVIVTGAGRAFCAGADLAAGASSFIFEDDDPNGLVRPDGSYDYSSEGVRDGGGRTTLRIFRCLKPVIGAINGPAVGIGATLTLPMDIRLASTAARIGFVFSRRGLVPEACSSFFLPRVVGISQALEWCLTGRVFSAEEALAGGLVRSLHAPEDLLPAARAIAAEIAENTSPVSVALSRQMLWRGLGFSDPMDAHRIDSRGIFNRGRSRDVAEGVTAFLEKRAPDFPERVSTDMPDYFPWWEEPQYR
jgi:enoyl-CoA hydratase/carnithine racemase